MLHEFHRRRFERRTNRYFSYSLISFCLATAFAVLLVSGAARVSLGFAVPTLVISAIYLRAETIGPGLSLRRIIALLLVCWSVTLIIAQW